MDFKMAILAYFWMIVCAVLILMPIGHMIRRLRESREGGTWWSFTCALIVGLTFVGLIYTRVISVPW